MLRLVYARDEGICWICRLPATKSATLDHVIPKSKGGKWVFGNLRLAHHHCNQKRGNADAPGPDGTTEERIAAQKREEDGITFGDTSALVDFLADEYKAVLNAPRCNLFGSVKKS